MGSVFLAEHVLIKRRVAIKVLRPEFSEDADVIERFMNEARAAGTLGHPNIVESTDMGFTREGVPYIVFEYLEGTLLTDEIYRVSGMPVRRAVRIARQIASALNAAHRAGVIHRDLKTDNVFLPDKEEASDHVKVLDFGISRFMETDDDRSGVRSLVMGTPQFMAPEQITEPENVDKRADIYALGVILYEMITARRPFNNEDPDALIHDILHTAPPPLNVPDLPPGLQEMLFTKLLSKDRANRYSTMRDVEGALEAFAGVIRDGRDTQPIPMQTLRRDSTEARIAAAKLITLPSTPRKSSGAIWLVGALVAAIAGGALMYLDSQAKAGGDETSATQTAALQGGAESVSLAIDSTLKAAQQRADGIAQTPMLRSAIETDAATVKDMVGNDFLFTPAEGEVFELVQIRDRTRATLLRMPPAGAALKPVIANEPLIESDGKTISIVVGTPVSTQKGAIGGLVQLRMPVDLSTAIRTLGPLVVDAKITGLGTPLVLAHTDPGTAKTATIELPVLLKGTKASAKLSIMTRAAGSAETARTYALARNASWGVGGLLLVIYLVFLLRGRTRG